MWKARLSELEFDERELTEVLAAIDSEWITAGPRTQAFEQAFARFEGCAHRCIYDSQKPVVLRWEGTQPIYNPRFLAFAAHYEFLKNLKLWEINSDRQD